MPLDPSCRFGVTNNTGNLTIHRHPGSRLQLTAAVRTSVCDREPGYPNQILIHTSCSCCSRRSVGNDASCVPNNQQSTFSQPSTTRLPPPSPQCPKLLPTDTLYENDDEGNFPDAPFAELGQLSRITQVNAVCQIRYRERLDM